MQVKKVKDKPNKLLLTPIDKYHIMAKKNKKLDELRKTFNLQLV
jgi:hypothetical protein